MIDDEKARTILYVKNMPIQHTGISIESYSKDSEYFNPKYEHIDWPYTGFVKGNILGWEPISIPELVYLLKKYHYPLDGFIQNFLTNNR